jgi:hypothetical protein
MAILRGCTLTFITVIGLALIMGLSGSSAWAAAAPASGPGVTVTNPVSNPVPVRDVENPARQPFQQELFLSTPDGLLGANDQFTVPSGKRLVIEFVSFTMNWPAGQLTTRAFINVCNASGNACPVSFYVPASFQATEFGGTDFFVASSPTRLYADPGSVVGVAVRRNVTAGTGLATVAVSGYLVDAP